MGGSLLNASHEISVTRPADPNDAPWLEELFGAAHGPAQWDVIAEHDNGDRVHGTMDTALRIKFTHVQDSYGEITELHPPQYADLSFDQF